MNSDNRPMSSSSRPMSSSIIPMRKTKRKRSNNGLSENGLSEVVENAKAAEAIVNNNLNVYADIIETRTYEEEERQADSLPDTTDSILNTLYRTIQLAKRNNYIGLCLMALYMLNYIILRLYSKYACYIETSIHINQWLGLLYLISKLKNKNIKF